MAKIAKRMQAIQNKLTPNKHYSVTEAVQLLIDVSKVKFKESIDVSINLGIDARKESVRGAAVLPHGTGREVRVAVLTQGANADAAAAAGADIVGFDDLAETIKGGELNFDVLIASPDAMRLVGQLGQILGPRGLMPNPKVGTVTPNVAEAVKNAKSGQVQYRADKAGIVHCSIGRMGFTPEQIAQNLDTLIADVKKNKPSTSKGVYIKKVSLSSTMGPGLAIEQGSLSL